MVEAEFFFGESEAGFDGPAAEGHAEQAAERDTILADDAVGEKVFNLAGADAAGNYECVSFAGEFLARIAPHGQMFNLPHFRTFRRLFNKRALPGLPVTLRRVLEQAADLAAVGASDELQSPRWTTGTAGRRPWNDPRLFRPDTHIAGDLGHKRLVPCFQCIEKGPVSTIQFIACPVRHTHAIAQSTVDQVDGNLRLRLE